MKSALRNAKYTALVILGFCFIACNSEEFAGSSSKKSSDNKEADTGSDANDGEDTAGGEDATDNPGTDGTGPDKQSNPIACSDTPAVLQAWWGHEKGLLVVMGGEAPDNITIEAIETSTQARVTLKEGDAAKDFDGVKQIQVCTFGGDDTIEINFGTKGILFATASGIQVNGGSGVDLMKITGGNPDEPFLNNTMSPTGPGSGTSTIESKTDKLVINFEKLGD